MRGRKRVGYSWIVLALAAALVAEPMSVRDHVGGGGPGLRWSSIRVVPDALAAAAGSVADFFGGLFGSPIRAEAARPSPPPTPAPPGSGEQEIVSKRTRDSKAFRLPDGKTRVEFAPYTHYESAPGTWDEVDLTFRPDGSDYVAAKHDVIVRVTGAGVLAIERGSGKGVLWRTPTRPVVSGRKATYTDAEGNAWSYFTTIPGLKMLSTVEAARGAKTYPFSYQLLGNATPFSVDPDGNLVSDRFIVPRAVVIGANNETYPASEWRIVEGSKVAFDFDDSTLPPEAFPYELDPAAWFSVTTGPDDSTVRKQDSAYPPATCTTGYGDSTLVNVSRLRDAAANIYAIHNGFVRWNTSSLPDTAWINSATVILQVTYVRNANGKKMTADYYNWTPPATCSHHSATAGTTASGSTGWTMPTSGGERTFALTALGNISKTGYTGLRFHLSGGTPTGENRIHWASKEHTSLAQPKLSIVYDNVAPTIQLDSPAANGEAPSVTPVLKALGTDGNGDPIDYQFQVFKASSPLDASTLIASSGWLPRTNTWTIPPGILKDGQPYWWRAAAIDGYGASSGWSGVVGFNVRLPKLGSRDYWPMWSHGPVSVNQANGNLVIGVPGPSYPGASGSLSASAAYNSKASGNNGLGDGWTLNAGEELASPPSRLVDHNLLPAGNPSRFDAVEAVFPDGSSDFYTHVGSSNTYTAAPGEGSELKKNADGTWSLLDVDGAIYTFGAAAPVTGVATLTDAQIVDADGDQVKLTYSFSTSSPPRILSITDGAGRVLSFTWNTLNSSGCPNAILCMTGPDNVTWRYVGSGTGGTTVPLARVDNGTRDLLALGYSAGRVTTVQNANDLNPLQASPGYNGNHAVTVAYDAQGRVAFVTEGPVTGQTPATATWSFQYFGPTTTSASSAHGGGRQADGYTVMTPPNQQGAPSPATARVYFDNLGRTMEAVDVLGNKALSHYNAFDQLVWSEDEEGNPTDNVYDTINNVLLSTTGPDPDGGGPLTRPVTTFRYDETAIGTAGTPGPPLTGLQASYYKNTSLRGRPWKRQNDATADFNWGTGGPAALGGQVDNFSIRWTANLNVSQAGAYTFSTVADDGTRLTVGNVEAISNWVGGAVRTVSSAPITLGVGLHKLVVEYFEATGPAEVHLRWSCAACATPIADQVIPSSVLRPAWMNQTSTVDPSGDVSFEHYADPAGGKPDYDLVRNGSQNLITSYAYDSFGRMTQKVMPKGNAARTIDGSGNLTGSPDLTFATTWTYYGLSETATIPSACGVGTAVEQAGLLKSLQHAGIAPTTTVYDPAGRPVAVTNGAGTTCSTFTAEGRLTSDKAAGEASATTYTYDPAGLIRTATDPSGVVTSEYDEAGRVKRTVDSFGSESVFVYDRESNLLSRTSAKGAITTDPYTTTLGYDVAGRVVSLTDPAGRAYGFTYTPRGSLRTVQYPNGTFSWRDYNAAGGMTAVYNRHGTLGSPLPGSVPADANPLADVSYAYDVEGKKTQEVRGGGGVSSETRSFTYDPVGRLATVVLPNGTLRAYSYDLDSNRTLIQETPLGGSPTTVASYTYSPAVTPGLDQLTSVTEGASTTTFGYTADGQVSAKGSAVLSWDGRGRHSGGSFSGTSVSYGFDAAGRRRQRTAGAGPSNTRRYLFAGAGESAVFETDGNSVLLRTQIPGPEGDLAHYLGAPSTSTTVGYLYFDGHGDLAAEANQSGVRTGSYSYDPFGGVLQAAPANTTVERWTGRWDKQLDTRSNLIQMGVRPYDPVLGRFLAVDPIEGGNLNPYDYAGQDPINGYDLDGQWGFFKCGWCRRVSSAVSGALGGVRRAAVSGARGLWGLRHAAVNLAAGIGTAAFLTACIASFCGLAAGAIGIATIGVASMGLHNVLASSGQRRRGANQLTWFAGTFRAQVQGAFCAFTIGGGCLRFLTQPRSSWSRLRSLI